MILFDALGVAASIGLFLQKKSKQAVQECPQYGDCLLIWRQFPDWGFQVTRGKRIWNFQGYQGNSMRNFQGLIKNEVEFSRVTKKK